MDWTVALSITSSSTTDGAVEFSIIMRGVTVLFSAGIKRVLTMDRAVVVVDDVLLVPAVVVPSLGLNCLVTLINFVLASMTGKVVDDGDEPERL